MKKSKLLSDQEKSKREIKEGKREHSLHTTWAASWVHRRRDSIRAACDGFWEITSMPWHIWPKISAIPFSAASTLTPEVTKRWVISFSSQVSNTISPLDWMKSQTFCKSELTSDLFQFILRSPKRGHEDRRACSGYLRDDERMRDEGRNQRIGEEREERALIKQGE